MPSPKYPLQPLLEHRERAAHDRTAELGGAVGERQRAEAALARAVSTQRAAEEAVATVREAEGELLVQGALTAGDLARGQAWEIGAQATLHELETVAARADEKAAEAKAGESEARQALAKAMADRDVVRKDEARFGQRLAKKLAAAEEEQADEAYRGKKP